jgi:hypothetical protein
MAGLMQQLAAWLQPQPEPIPEPASESPAWRVVGPVRRGQNCVLDGSGNGTIVFSVFSANHKFELDSVVVKAAGATPALYPQVTLYNGLNQQDARSQGASWLGGQVTFHGHIEMNNADDLTVGFTKGTAGTVLTAVIEGTNYLWR